MVIPIPPKLQTICFNAGIVMELTTIVVRHNERSRVIMPFPQRGRPEKHPLARGGCDKTHSSGHPVTLVGSRLAR